MNLHNVMLIALGAAALFEVAAYFAHREGRRALVILGLIAVVALAVQLWVPEPALKGAVFGAAPEEGGFSVMVAVGVMFVAICFGIAARYIFEADKSFNWFELLRPLVISPILLLPLIGTLDNGELQPLQLVSLSVLSFQNGFFWQKVLASIKPSEKPLTTGEVDSDPVNT